MVYGAGIYGGLFCEELEKNGIHIEYVIDQYVNKKEVNNKPIKRLNELDLKDTNIYISITSPMVERVYMNNC